MAEKKELGQTLLERNIALSFQYGVPLIDLREHEVQPYVLALIPEEMARKHNVLPLAVGIDGELTVVMQNPGDQPLIDTLTAQSQKRIRPVLSLHGGIPAAVDREYRKLQIISHAAEETFSKEVPEEKLSTEEVPPKKKKSFFHWLI